MGELTAPASFLHEMPEVREVVELFLASGLSGPVNDSARMAKMLELSQEVVVARISGELVGLIRVLTDFAFNAFVADLAVAPRWQRRGIGSELVRRVTADYRTVKFVVHPGCDSREFYLKLGFVSAPECVYLPRTE